MGVAAAALATLVTSGCAAAPFPAGDGGPPSGDAGELVPAGFGSLRQDDITVTLRSGPVQVRVTPLEEWVVRLTAPDTYRRLAELGALHGPEVERRTGAGAALFLVSFHSEQPGAAFQPDALHLVNRGRRQRPLHVRALTGGWGTQRLGQRETQSAVYGFDAGVDLAQELTVEYHDARSDAWGRILPLLQAERERARARAGGGGS